MTVKVEVEVEVELKLKAETGFGVVEHLLMEVKL